jgi:Uma2 family endonuclease
MATNIQTQTLDAHASPIPLLRNGDRLTRAEFLRRYHAMPDLHHAELIEGRVYMPSPVSAARHGEPHFDFITWLGVYRAMTPGVVGGDNSTLNLDLDNAPQPDGYLRITEQAGGQTRMEDGYLVGAPELIVEVAASSVSYDLHDKLNVYRRNGVCEYLVWRTEDRAMDRFILTNGRFETLPVGDDGILRSTVLPGLWLDPAAVMRGDLRRALEVLNLGITDASHESFVEKLKSPKP